MLFHDRKQRFRSRGVLRLKETEPGRTLAVLFVVQPIINAVLDLINGIIDLLAG